jgi:hypothetical protein
MCADQYPRRRRPEAEEFDEEVEYPQRRARPNPPIVREFSDDESDEEVEYPQRRARPNPSNSRVSIREFLDQGANLDKQERELWNQYLERHPELKPYTDYLVAIDFIERHETYDTFRALNIDDLENRYLVVVEKSPVESNNTLLANPHEFDSIIYKRLNHDSRYGELLEMRMLFGNEKSRKRVISQYHKGSDPETRINLRNIFQKNLVIKDLNGAGLVLFLSDEQQAKKFNDALNRGEQFRQLFTEFLPDLTIKYSVPVITRDYRTEWSDWVDWKENYDDVLRYDGEVKGKIFATEDPETSNRFTLDYDILTHILDRIVEKHDEVHQITKNTVEQKPDSVIVHVTTRITQTVLPKIKKEVYQSGYKRLHDKMYQDAVKYGDFKLKVRGGVELRVDSARLRAICPPIRKLLTSKIGSNTVRDNYNASNYSKQAVEIFIRGIYEQDIADLLTPNLLPELYDLFFELQCQYEPLGLQFNEYLGIHIQTFEDPLDFIGSLYDQLNNDPELSTFSEQIRRLYNELNGKNIPSESDYLEYARHILNQIKSNLSDENPWTRFNIELQIIELRKEYTGIGTPDDAYFKTIIEEGGKRLEQVVRTEWTIFPLKKVEITYPKSRPGYIEYTLIPRFTFDAESDEE